MGVANLKWAVARATARVRLGLGLVGVANFKWAMARATARVRARARASWGGQF